MSQPEQLYRLEIKASGEVRDKDGNLLNADVAVDGMRIVTESEMRQMLDKGDQR